MGHDVSIPLDYAMKDTQSLKQLWESIRQLADGRVIDNEKCDSYPMDIRERQLTTLQSLVITLAETHEKARAEYKGLTHDQHFEQYDFAASCNAMVTDVAAWQHTGKQYARRVYLEEIGTGRDVDGVFVVDYQDNYLGVAEFRIG